MTENNNTETKLDKNKESPKKERTDPNSNQKNDDESKNYSKRSNKENSDDISNTKNKNNTTESSDKKNQNQNNTNSQEDAVTFTFRNEIENVELRKVITDSYIKNRKNPNLPEIVENMKNDLDQAFSKGWIVFGGQHMVGVCSYIENTLADFDVDGISFVIFQTIHPDD